MRVLSCSFNRIIVDVAVTNAETWDVRSYVVAKIKAALACLYRNGIAFPDAPDFLIYLALVYCAVALIALVLFLGLVRRLDVG